MLRFTRPICSPPGGVGGGRQRWRRGHRSIRDEFHKIRKTERRRRRRRRRQSEYFEGSFCQCPSRSAFWRRSNTVHDCTEQHNGEGPCFYNCLRSIRMSALLIERTVLGEARRARVATCRDLCKEGCSRWIKIALGLGGGNGISCGGGGVRAAGVWNCTFQADIFGAPRLETAAKPHFDFQI